MEGRATACAVSSVATVATGIRDGHKAVSPITTAATGIRDEHKAAATPPGLELNKMDVCAPLQARHNFCVFNLITKFCIEKGQFKIHTSRHASDARRAVTGSQMGMCKTWTLFASTDASSKCRGVRRGPVHVNVWVCYNYVVMLFPPRNRASSYVVVLITDVVANVR